MNKTHQKLIERQYKKGISGRIIADKIGVSHETVYTYIRKNKLKKANRPTLTRTLIKGKTVQEIVEDTGWSRSSVYEWKKKNKLKLKKGQWTR